MKTAVVQQVERSTEHRFYLALTILITAAVMLGFARTFFLRFWFPEWTSIHAPHESFFYFHGTVFFLWLILLVTQASLVTLHRIEIHRRLGWACAFLAFAIIVVGFIAAVIAARRKTGFIDVPLPPLNFMAIPLTDIALFGSFAALGILSRRHVQSHKRYMLLASIGLLDAPISRWPFGNMGAALPIPGFMVLDACVDAFLLPMIVWDIVSLRRIHAVTLFGGIAVILSQPLRFMIANTKIWVAFAGWAVNLFR